MTTPLTNSTGESSREDGPPPLSERLDSIIHSLERLDERLRNIENRIRRTPDELLTEAQALHQLISRFSPEATLPPVNGWALSPSALIALVDLITQRGARNVVECGSGSSTLWIAYALRHLGAGRVTALDHLAEYANKTRALVAAHGLADFVDVRHAPLANTATPKGSFSWYSLESVALATPIDVLLVDGPPQSTGQLARYPAMPLLVEHLAPDALILVDDAHRPDERKMVEEWLNENPRLKRVGRPAIGVEVLALKP